MEYIKIKSYNDLLKYDGKKVFYKRGDKYISAIVGCINDESGCIKMSHYPEGFLYLGSDCGSLDGEHPKIAKIMNNAYAYCIVANSFHVTNIYIDSESLKAEISNEFLN